MRFPDLCNILNKERGEAMELKDFIKEYRLKHDLTMEQFGNLASLSKGYVSMLEKGINPKSKKKLIPSLTVLKNIACAMNIDLNRLLECVDDLEVNIDSASQNIGLACKLSDREMANLKKYRQLDESRKQAIDDQIDYLLFKQAQEAESKEEHLA